MEWAAARPGAAADHPTARAKPSSTGGARSEPRVRQAELRKEHLTEARCSARILAVAASLWPFWIVFDYLESYRLHAGSFLGLLASRLACEAWMVYAWYRFARKPPASERAFDALVVASMMVFSGSLAAMCLATTGFASIYVAGNFFVAIGSALVPRPFRPSALRVFLALMIHPAVLLVGTRFVPRLEAQLSDPRTAAILLQYLIVALLLGVGISALSHALYRLRNELFEARSIGRYRLQRRLGTGGMSEIWSAYHVGLKRDVALKILEPRLGDELSRKRFGQEVEATAALTHPNTVRVFDFGTTDEGLLFYAMEQLEGETLAQFVKRRGPLPAARAIHLVRQAAAALSEAHSRRLVHRDIKPQNLFVTTAGTEPDFVKVLDFGIAVLETWSREHELNSAEEIAGSAMTISPEVVTGHSATAASDVYGLGAVLYFALTAEYPFGRRHYVEALRAHAHEAPPRPSRRLSARLPRDLEDLVMRCLEKSPSARPSDAQELEAELATLAERYPWRPRRDAPRVDAELEQRLP